MGRWQREALTEVRWREVAAPPPSPAATVPLPIASRQGGWDGRYQPLPVVNPPSNQKHHPGGKKYRETLKKQPEIILRPDLNWLPVRRERGAHPAPPILGIPESSRVGKEECENGRPQVYADSVKKKKN